MLYRRIFYRTAIRFAALFARSPGVNTPPPTPLHPTWARHRITPGEEFQYWRWASALSLAVAESGGGTRVAGPAGSFKSVVRGVKASSSGPDGSQSPEKNADAICTLRPQEGLVSRPLPCVVVFMSSLSYITTE